MDIKQISVTPEMARELLKLNTDNRRLREHHIKYLADEITRGAWVVSLDPIAVSTEGVLLNGQHRLSAVVLADKPADMMFAKFVNKEVYDVTDRGLQRTLSDVTTFSPGFCAETGLIHFAIHGYGRRVPIDVIRDIAVWWRPAHDAITAGAKANPTFLGHSSLRVGFGLRWAVEEQEANRKYVADQFHALLHFDTQRMSHATSRVYKRMNSRDRGRGYNGSRTDRLLLATEVFFAMRPGSRDLTPMNVNMDERTKEVCDWLSRMEAAYQAAPKDGHPYLFTKPKAARKGAAEATKQTTVAQKRSPRDIQIAGS